LIIIDYKIYYNVNLIKKKIKKNTYNNKFTFIVRLLKLMAIEINSNSSRID